MTTFSLKAGEIKRDWHLVDAKGQVLGRIATGIATRLMGKHKPTYTAHLDTGDHVVVINAKNVLVTGKKSEQKLYRRHSGYPGGMKVTTYKQHILTHAISGMLPDNKLKKKVLRHLHVYPEAAHPYAKQFKLDPTIEGKA